MNKVPIFTDVAVLIAFWTLIIALVDSMVAALAPPPNVRFQVEFQAAVPVEDPDAPPSTDDTLILFATACCEVGPGIPNTK